jgi:hypothetical protein
VILGLEFWRTRGGKERKERKAYTLGTLKRWITGRGVWVYLRGCDGSTWGILGILWGQSEKCFERRF